MTPFMRFLDGRLAQLIPHLQRRVEMRVALHRHPGVAGVMEPASDILRAIPGIELVDLEQPAVGLQSFSDISLLGWNGPAPRDGKAVALSFLPKSVLELMKSPARGGP